MTVAFDAATESIRTDNSGTWAFNHTPVGTPRGVLVFAAEGVNVAHTFAVTYGGVAMEALATVRNIGGEAGEVRVFFLGASIPTGTQSVSASVSSSTTNDIQYTCITFTGSADTSIVDVAELFSNSLADPSLTLYKLGLDAIAVGLLYSGQNAPSSLTSGGGQTRVSDHDFGLFSSALDRESSSSTSDFSLGFTATADDVAMVAVAITDATIVDTLAFDAATESVRTDTSTSGSFDHTPVGTPRGVLVFATIGGLESDVFTGFTYGGVAMGRVGIVGQSAGDDDSTTVAYFLGAGVLTGTQSVGWTLSSGISQDIHFVAISVVADSNTKVLDFQTLDSDASGNQIDPRLPALSHAGVRAISFGALFDGANSAASIVTTVGQARLHDHTFAANATAVDRRTRAYQNGRAIQWTVGNEQVGAISVAIGNDPDIRPDWSEQPASWSLTRWHQPEDDALGLVPPPAAPFDPSPYDWSEQPTGWTAPRWTQVDDAFEAIPPPPPAFDPTVCDWSEQPASWSLTVWFTPELDTLALAQPPPFDWSEQPTGWLVPRWFTVPDPAEGLEPPVPPFDAAPYDWSEQPAFWTVARWHQTDTEVIAFEVVPPVVFDPAAGADWSEQPGQERALVVTWSIADAPIEGFEPLPTPPPPGPPPVDFSGGGGGGGQRRKKKLPPIVVPVVARTMFDDMTKRYGYAKGRDVYFAMQRERKGPFAPGKKYDPKRRP